MADGVVTLVYTDPTGFQQNLAVASDTLEVLLQTDWVDFGNPSAQPNPGPRKKRLRRIRLEVDGGLFVVKLEAKNKLEQLVQFTDTYEMIGNSPLTFPGPPPMMRWWRLTLDDPHPQNRWAITRIQVWGDLGGMLLDDHVVAPARGAMFTGELTLAAGVGLTLLSDHRIRLGSKIFLDPLTPNAAAAALVRFTSSVAEGVIMLSHNVSTLTDRRFAYVVV